MSNQILFISMQRGVLDHCGRLKNVKVLIVGLLLWMYYIIGTTEIAPISLIMIRPLTSLVLLVAFWPAVDGGKLMPMRASHESSQHATNMSPSHKMQVG